MKKVMGDHRLTVSVLLAVMTVLTLSVPAQAKWYWLHGSAGHALSGGSKLNNCLSVLVSPYESTYAQFPILSSVAKKTGARYVKIDFETSDPAIVVQQIRVWNGGSMVKEFEDLSHSGDYTGSNALKVDLGKVMKFNRGMLIVASFMNTSPAINHTVKFYGLGAKFVTK